MLGDAREVVVTALFKKSRTRVDMWSRHGGLQASLASRLPSVFPSDHPLRRLSHEASHLERFTQNKSVVFIAPFAGGLYIAPRHSDHIIS